MNSLSDSPLGRRINGECRIRLHFFILKGKVVSIGIGDLFHFFNVVPE